MAFVTQIIPICTFHQMNLMCAAAKMIAPFSRLVTEVPNTTGETGKEETSGFFPLRCHEILEGCQTNWGMTRVLFSTSEVSADPHVWIQLVGLDFWNFLCHIKSNSQSPPFSLHQIVQFSLQGITVVHLWWGNLNKTGETGYKEWNVADWKLRQSFPSLLLSSLLQALPAGKRKKIALGPAVKKAYHSQREIYQFGGFLQQLSSSQSPSGRGCRGCYPTPPCLTTPFGLLLQEWAPEHVLLFGPEFS